MLKAKHRALQKFQKRSDSQRLYRDSLWLKNERVFKLLENKIKSCIVYKGANCNPISFGSFRKDLQVNLAYTEKKKVNFPQLLTFSYESVLTFTFNL